MLDVHVCRVERFERFVAVKVCQTLFSCQEIVASTFWRFTWPILIKALLRNLIKLHHPNMLCSSFVVEPRDQTYKEFFSVDLCSARFWLWLVENFKPITAVKTRVA